MSDFDVGILIMMGIFTLLGVYWGLIRQVLSLVGLIAGLILAGSYGPTVAGWLSSFVGEPALAGVIGFVLVLALVSTLASVVASLLRLFTGLLFLGWLDHLLGGVLGLVQAIIAAAALLIGLVTFPAEPWSSALAESTLAGWVLVLGEPLTALLPDLFAAAVQAFNR